jgi:hypothetical protein
MVIEKCPPSLHRRWHLSHDSILLSHTGNTSHTEGSTSHPVVFSKFLVNLGIVHIALGVVSTC